MYFPMIDLLIDMFHKTYEWYGSKVIFHTKYNKEQFLKDIDGGKWFTRTGELSYLRECPNIRTKVDFFTAHLLNIIIPITPWLWLILEKTGKL
jgi:hypothetical protein